MRATHVKVRLKIWNKNPGKSRWTSSAANLCRGFVVLLLELRVLLGFSFWSFQLRQIDFGEGN